MKKVFYHLKYLLRHPHHFFWYPHQGIWNMYTNKLPILRHLFIFADTLHLFLKTSNKNKIHPSNHVKKRIIFLDIGLHKNPVQSLRMMDWFADDYEILFFAFEAHPEYIKNAKEIFENHKNTLSCPHHVQAQFFNVALVGPDDNSKHVELYLSDNIGKGNSLFKTRGRNSIKVDATRLSKILTEQNIDFNKDIVLLRMNVEGAELYIIEDLVQAGLVNKIKGYFGMWDDLHKIDPALDEKLKALLKDNNIKPITFNDRDTQDTQSPILHWREDVIRNAIKNLLS